MSDVNGDGIIDGKDLGEILKHLNTVLGDYNYSPAADVNHDGVVNELDMMLVRGEIRSQLSEIGLAA